ncbi:MAG TPA: ABC transporter permease [Oscillospiraceae bacterium]|nr:ABC transporter permease [Oscillospiraceae bacterium]HPF55163.1 ABC transporter permease [Clostridiales bacterium]HPK34598.1 ABC transporter permease [Oscillospiraceae bacterium]HPR75938.1 ABC transporter permease [Oscillospiraceae bacterium]
MNNRLFLRLARTNLARNRRMYLPYAIATAIMSAMFFIIINTVFSKSISNMSYGPTMMAMLQFGIIVMALFTFGYMLYLNSFLIKRRKKEFGLYGILGLEKRHVSRIILTENTILNFSSLGTGLLLGTVFGKLIFMLLMVIVHSAPASKFELSPTAYLITILFFGLIFFVTSIYNQFRVRLANPIDLINGDKKGEKKLRGVIPLSLLGLACTGVGYYVSFVVKGSGAALGFFWPAVILVIIGTNLLFVSGSQFVLRAIKKNPRLYYKPRNFVSVSGLVHRMKQNALGLANICILSTMVLVTVSSVCALFFGQEGILDVQHPVDYQVNISYNASEPMPDMSSVPETIQALAEKKGVQIESIYIYNAIQNYIILSDGELTMKSSDGTFTFNDLIDSDNQYKLYLIPLSDYNTVTGENAALDDNEILVLSENPVNSNVVTAPSGDVFSIKSVRSGTVFTDCKNSVRTNVIYIIAKDMTTCAKLDYTGTDDTVDRRRIITDVNLVGSDFQAYINFTDATGEKVYQIARDQLSEATYSTSSIDRNRAQNYATYGGLLFIGIFFVILFLVNTVLIMYFKQVSEGYEDRERYEIMRKVGMSDEEVRATINRQVLIVFFLPLAMALAHIFAATNIITQIVNAFVMLNNALTLICIGVSVVVYILVYIFAFRATAKTYYKIVK